MINVISLKLFGQHQDKATGTFEKCTNCLKSQSFHQKLHCLGKPLKFMNYKDWRLIYLHSTRYFIADNVHSGISAVGIKMKEIGIFLLALKSNRSTQNINQMWRMHPNYSLKSLDKNVSIKSCLPRPMVDSYLICLFKQNGICLEVGSA